METRAAGAGINVASNMLFTFIIGQCFTTMLCTMRYGVFLFFAGALSLHPCYIPKYAPNYRRRAMAGLPVLSRQHGQRS